MAEYTALNHRVFLSCSLADAAWGEWLRAALESYRIESDLVGRRTPAGPVPKTLRPIFCAGQDGSADDRLAIWAALRASCFARRAPRNPPTSTRTFTVSNPRAAPIA